MNGPILGAYYDGSLVASNGEFSNRPIFFRVSEKFHRVTENAMDAGIFVLHNYILKVS